MASSDQPTGPDLSAGVPVSDLPDGGMLAGQVDGEAVLLARRGDEFFAIGATCTHYGGPLAEGLIVGDTVRCPWHHACFSLRTGEALGAPALNDVDAWTVERRDGKVVVTGKRADPVPARTPATAPESVVILGAGAAGHAAAEQLRREGYDGPVTLVDQDGDEPYDKPNLSKDYLAGNAPEEWIPLRGDDFFAGHGIDTVFGRAVRKIDVEARRLELDDGGVKRFDRLLIATGAAPVRLPVPVSRDVEVHYLRTLADSRDIVVAAANAKTAVVIGASFIGLEVAASLRARDLDVHVVAPEDVPLARIMGKDLGVFVQRLHEEHGVTFHLEHSVKEVTPEGVVRDDDVLLEANLIVAGIGVEPRDEMARVAGLDVDNGIIVNDRLETSVEGIYAAGDVARYPDHRTGELVRVEHWVHAQRMGQHAARTMLGAEAPYTTTPFFWSQHYDVAIAYVGHAAGWDHADLDGDPAEKDCAVRFRRGDDVLAVASIFRDDLSLRTEAEMDGARV